MTAYVPYLPSWKIKVNEAKTLSAQTVAKAAPDCYVRVNGFIVPWIEQVIYLGVIFDTKLLYWANTDSLKRRCSDLVKARGSRILNNGKDE